MEFQGELTYSTNPQNSKVPSFRQIFAFHIAVDEPRWRIRIRQIAGNARNEYLLYTEIGYNGTDIAKVGVVAPKAITVTNTHSSSRTSQVITNLPLDSPAIVIPGPIPPAQFENATALWLAFVVRSNTFNSIIGAMIPPVWDVSNEEFSKDKYIVVPKLHDAEPFYLDQLSIISDGSTRARSGKRVQWPEPYHRGFLQAQFVVNDWETSFDGRALPKKFILNVFAPKQFGNTTNELDTIMTWEGQVTNYLQSADLGVGLPTLRGRTIVSDYRHEIKGSNGVQAIVYAKSTGWASKDDPRLKRLILRMTGNQKSYSGAGMLFMAIATASTIFLTVLIFRLRRAEFGKDKNEKQ